MNSDIKFSQVPGGTKFIRAESMLNSRRLFIKVNDSFPLARGPNAINAVDLHDGEPRCFADDLEVITVL